MPGPMPYAIAGLQQAKLTMQDKITRQIVGHLAVELTRLERERAVSQPTESLAAYE